jgi:hypothetical protein
MLHLSDTTPKIRTVSMFVNIWLKNMRHRKWAIIFMVYLCTKLHMTTSNNFLFIATRAESIENIPVTTMLLSYIL